jgi:hypothetical protein
VYDIWDFYGGENLDSDILRCRWLHMSQDISELSWSLQTHTLVFSQPRYGEGGESDSALGVLPPPPPALPIFSFYWDVVQACRFLRPVYTLIFLLLRQCALSVFWRLSFKIYKRYKFNCIIYTSQTLDTTVWIVDPFPDCVLFQIRGCASYYLSAPVQFSFVGT